MRNQRLTYHGDGIVSKEHRVRTKDGIVRRTHYYVRFKHRGKRQLVQAGTTEKQARALQAKIQVERERAKLADVKWIPPKQRAAQLREQERRKELERRRREECRLGPVADRFMRRHLSDYARPDHVEGGFGRLRRYFGDERQLSEISRADVQAYIDDRVGARGVFRQCKKGAVRSAQVETRLLSRLFAFVIDEEGEDLKNPCARAWVRRRKQYRPAHEAIVPTERERGELFTIADEVGKDLGSFIRLCYYTAARPESEACRLLRGDVVFSDDEQGRFAGGGFLTFRRTKTGEDRTIPMHPELERVLRAHLLPRPTDPTKLERWRQRPVFGTVDDGRIPWSKYGYARRWRTVRKRAAQEYPRLLAMWLRDWRKAAITDMRASGTDAAIAAKLAGHSERMSDHYTQATTEATRRAILRLGA